MSKLGKWPFCLACCCRDIVPLGKVRSNFNFSLDGKRVLNFENVVTDDDNVKQVRTNPATLHAQAFSCSQQGAKGEAVLGWCQSMWLLV